MLVKTALYPHRRYIVNESVMPIRPLQLKEQLQCAYGIIVI